MAAPARTAPGVLPQSVDESFAGSQLHSFDGRPGIQILRVPCGRACAEVVLTTDIVILSWNGREDTLAALASIGSVPSDASIIVVDNASTDGTTEAVIRQFPAVRVLQLRTNRGFTGGIRAAVESSDADEIVFLNNDATVSAGWLESLRSTLRSGGEDAIAAGGKILDPTGSRIDFVGGLVTFDGHAFQRGFRMPAGSIDEPGHGEQLLFACGGNMIVKRRPYMELGGFDDDFFAYLEDVDFGWRATLSGYRILYDSSAVAFHKSSATSDRIGSFERGVLFERNALQTIFKNAEDIRAISGPVLLAYLSRLHTYVTRRNADTAPLTRPAFGDESTPGPGGRSSGLLARMRSSLLRRLAGHDSVVLSDPLTAMQFRALEWFFANEGRLMEKRAVVQSRRRSSDKDILARFPLHAIPTYEGDATLMASALFRQLLPDGVRFTSLEEVMKR